MSIKQDSPFLESKIEGRKMDDIYLTCIPHFLSQLKLDFNDHRLNPNNIFVLS